ncbi:MAG: glycosyltransferase family 2 protein, partial [Eubacteriales bacterium]|nr:glycosyltransferase family 2 protein [Eubacteriales bacterium]
LSPIIELFGLLLIAMMAILGILDAGFTLQLLLIYGLFGAVLSITAYFQRIYTQNLKLSPRDVLYAIMACVVESVFFRYVLAYVRATAFFSYKKRKGQWGVIRRAKINKHGQSAEKAQ